MSKKDRLPQSIEVVGSAIIENPKGEILLVKSEKWNNKWTMPGGHIDPGETIERGLLREAKEEVGLKLRSQGIISFGELINSKDFHRPAHFIYFDLWCKTETTKIKLDNEELQDHVWIKPKEALGMKLAESYRETIEDYLEFKDSKPKK